MGGKKAVLPPRASNKSQKTVLARQRQERAARFLRRHWVSFVGVACAWLCALAYPSLKRWAFPRKARLGASSSRRRSGAGGAVDAGAEWAVVMARGDAAATSGDFAAAVGHYRAAIRVSPKLSPAHTNLCHAALSLGDLEAALEACAKGFSYAADDRERAAALINYGVLQRRGFGPRGVAAALDAWERAADLDGDSVLARLYYAKAAVSAGKVREALDPEVVASIRDILPHLSRERVAHALEAHDGDFDRALEYLMADAWGRG